MRHHYSFTTQFNGYCVVITNPTGAEISYLQGDDAEELLADIENLDSITYPSGPFETYEDHLDALLSPYEPDHLHD